MTFAERFGRNLARLREQKHLSQEELGIRAGLHRTAVGQLERGQQIARVDSLVRLAGALGVRPEKMLDGLTWTPTVLTVGEMEVSDDHEAERP